MCVLFSLNLEILNTLNREDPQAELLPIMLLFPKGEKRCAKGVQKWTVRAREDLGKEKRRAPTDKKEAQPKNGRARAEKKDLLRRDKRMGLAGKRTGLVGKKGRPRRGKEKDGHGQKKRTGPAANKDGPGRGKKECLQKGVPTQRSALQKGVLAERSASRAECLHN